MNTDTSNAEQQERVRCSALLGHYRDSRKELSDFKGWRFAPGTQVTVDCERYKGPGVVAADYECPVDKLPVRLENGNVWWYPLEACWPNK